MSLMTGNLQAVYGIVDSPSYILIVCLAGKMPRS